MARKKAHIPENKEDLKRRPGRPPSNEGRYRALNVNVRPEVMEWLDMRREQTGLTSSAIVDAVLGEAGRMTMAEIIAIVSRRKEKNINATLKS